MKLERVAPWIVDSDIGVLSERCSRLSHLSLVGCRALTEGTFGRSFHLYVFTSDLGVNFLTFLCFCVSAFLLLLCLFLFAVL